MTTPRPDRDFADPYSIVALCEDSARAAKAAVDGPRDAQDYADEMDDDDGR